MKFSGDPFGTPTKWCELKFDQHVRQFKIYKASDPKDVKFICHISPEGVYIDGVERVKWSWKKEIDDYGDDARAGIGYFKKYNHTGPFPIQPEDECALIPSPSSNAMSISFRSNDGETVIVDRNSSLIRMSTYLNNMLSVSNLNCYVADKRFFI